MYSNRIQYLERENVVYKKKLDECEDHNREYKQSLERRLQETRDRLNHEESAHARTNSELTKVQANFEAREQLVRDLEVELEKVKAERVKMQSSNELMVSEEFAVKVQELKDVSEQLKEERLKITGLWWLKKLKNIP